MKRNIYLIVILQLLLISSVHARCNLELFRFGSSYSEIENQLGNAPKVSASNENRLFIPGEWVCWHKNSWVYFLSHHILTQPM